MSGDKNYLQQLIPRLGRRASHNNIQEDSRLDEDLLESSAVTSGESDRSQRQGPGPVVPPRTRKTGWGDELKSAKYDII